MEGDRKRCLDAGMDDYIAKPINPQKMFGTIKNWIKMKMEKPVEEPAAEPVVEAIPRVKVLSEDSDKTSPVDMDNAMLRFGNDREFFKEMVREFLNYMPDQIEDLEVAATSEDAPMVQKNAHSIKGAAGNLSAQGIFNMALQIESMGQGGDVSGVSSLIEDLKSEISSLEQFAKKL